MNVLPMMSRAALVLVVSLLAAPGCRVLDWMGDDGRSLPADTELVFGFPWGVSKAGGTGEFAVWSDSIYHCPLYRIVAAATVGNEAITVVIDGLVATDQPCDDAPVRPAAGRLAFVDPLMGRASWTTPMSLPDGRLLLWFAYRESVVCYELDVAYPVARARLLSVYGDAFIRPESAEMDISPRVY